MIRLWKRPVIVAAMAGCYIHAVDINPYAFEHNAQQQPHEEIVYTAYDGDYVDDQQDEDDLRSYNSARIITARTAQGRLVGIIRFGASTTNTTPYLNQQCTLITLAVEKQYRTRGIGRELMRHMLATLKESCETVEWISTQSAIPFYLKLGAVPYYVDDLPRFTLSTNPNQPINHRTNTRETNNLM